MYMESRKMVLMNLFTGQQWRCRHREQMFVDTGNREEGEGGANGESNMEAIYATTYKTDNQGEFAV